jgi:hypothetical protein
MIEEAADKIQHIKPTTSYAQAARIGNTRVSGVPGIDGHPGNDNGSAGCGPAADRVLAE